jgi:hypothetical protein
MKKFENPALPAPIYIYGDIFYSPCLPYYHFHLENIGDLKVRLKIGDDLLAHIVSAYHKNKDLFQNEGNEFIADITSHKIVCADSKGNLYHVSAYVDTHLALLAYGNKNQDTLLNIVKLEIKSIDLALAERDDLPTDILIALLNKDNISVNTILLKKGRYNDDETLLSAINTCSLPVIEAIAEKEDISPVVFQTLKRFYDDEGVVIKLIQNKNLPEHMLADIAQLHIWSPQAHISIPFHPQYTQYMDEYRKFSKLDISSDKLKQKVQEFFRIGDFILPLYRTKP